MSRKRNHTPSKRAMTKIDVVRKTKRRLALVLTILAVPLALLIFKAGFSMWPEWLVHWRMVLIGILAVAVMFLGLMSPIIIEFTKDPRPLSVPGKNPEMGGDQ